MIFRVNLYCPFLDLSVPELVCLSHLEHRVISIPKFVDVCFSSGYKLIELGQLVFNIMSNLGWKAIQLQGESGYPLYFEHLTKLYF